MVSVRALLGALPMYLRMLVWGLPVRLRMNGNECHTDGDTITVPAVPLDARTDTSFAVVLFAKVMHEVAHILYTDFGVWYQHCGEGMAQRMLNILEDVGVERQIAKRLKGAAKRLAAMVAWMIKEGEFTAPELGDPPATIIRRYMLFRLRADVLGQPCEDLAEASEKVLVATFPATFQTRLDVLMYRVSETTSTAERVVLRDQILEMIKDEEEKAKQPPPPQQQPLAQQGTAQSPQAGGDEDDGSNAGNQPQAGGDEDGGSNAGNEPQAGGDEDDGSNAGNQPQAGGDEDDGSNAGNQPQAGGDEDGGSNAGTQPQAGGDEDDGSDAGNQPQAGGDEDDGSNAGNQPQAGGDEDDGSNAGNQPQAGGSPNAGTPNNSSAQPQPVPQPTPQSQALHDALADDSTADDEDIGEVMARILQTQPHGGRGEVIDVPEEIIPGRYDGSQLLRDVRRASDAVRFELDTVIAAETRSRRSCSDVGTEFAIDELYKPACGDPMIFEHRSIGKRTDTAVQVVVDASGSMSTNDKFGLAIRAGLAVSVALEEVDGADVSVCSFPVGNNNDAVSVLSQFGESVKESAGRFAAIRPDGWSTPTERALLWAGMNLLAQPQPRKILFVITDDGPNDPEACKRIIRLLEAEGVELVGLGIGVAVKDIFPCSAQITALNQLATVVFRILEDKMFELEAA